MMTMHTQNNTNNLTLERTIDAIYRQNIHLAHVVAYDNHRAIGKNNALAWHVPEDLRHFKRITTGGIIIMGRKTFESMGRALPNRTNIVITNNPNWHAKDTITCQSLAQALQCAHNALIEKTVSAHNTNHTSDYSPHNTIFIIGGGQIFAQSVDFMDMLYITHLDLNIDGDAFYPQIPTQFMLTDEKHCTSQNGVKLRFLQFLRT